MSDALVKLEERVRELERMQQNLLILNKIYSELPRLVEGTLVYADGTTWNPGAGEGLYQYKGGGWRRVGILSDDQIWTGAQRGAYTTLTSSSGSIAVDMNAGNYFSHTLTENTTLANPSNIVAGQSGIFKFTQHASSPKTIDFGSYWIFEGGTEPELSTTVSAVDVLVYEVLSTTSILATLLKDVK